MSGDQIKGQDENGAEDTTTGVTAWDPGGLRTQTDDPAVTVTDHAETVTDHAETVTDRERGGQDEGVAEPSRREGGGRSPVKEGDAGSGPRVPARGLRRARTAGGA